MFSASAFERNLAYVTILAARRGLFLSQHSTQNLTDYTGTLYVPNQSVRWGFLADLVTKWKRTQASASHPISQAQLEWQTKKIRDEKKKRTTQLTGLFSNPHSGLGRDVGGKLTPWLGVRPYWCCCVKRHFIQTQRDSTGFLIPS